MLSSLSQYPITLKTFNKSILYLGISFTFQIIVIALQKIQPQNLGGNFIASSLSFLLLFFSIIYFLKNTSLDINSEKKDNFIENQKFSNKFGEFSRVFSNKQTFFMSISFKLGWTFFISSSMITVLSSFIQFYSPYGKETIFFVWFLLFIGSLFLLYYYVQENYKVLIFEKGLIIQNLHDLILLKFEDIEFIYQRMYKKNFSGIKKVFEEIEFDYVLTTVDKKKFYLPRSIQDIKDLGDIVARGIFKTSIHKYQKDFLKGERLNFVELSISTEGVWRRDNLYTWDEIDDVRVADGQLFVKTKKNTKLKFEIQNIPNFLILYEFLPAWHNYKRMYF